MKLYICLLLLVPTIQLPLELNFCASDASSLRTLLERMETLTLPCTFKAHSGKIGNVCADAIAEHAAFTTAGTMNAFLHPR